MYHPAFRRDFYLQKPALSNAPFEVQTRAPEESRFRESDFYSNGLRKTGWLAANIVEYPGPNTASCLEKGFGQFYRWNFSGTFERKVDIGGNSSTGSIRLMGIWHGSASGHLPAQEFT